MAPLGAKSVSLAVFTRRSSLALRKSGLNPQSFQTYSITQLRAAQDGCSKWTRRFNKKCVWCPPSKVARELPNKNSLLNAWWAETAARSHDKSARSAEYSSPIRGGPEQGRRCRWDGKRPGRRCESAKGDWCLWNIRGRSRGSHMATRRGLQTRVEERIVNFATGIFSIGEFSSSFRPIDIVNSTHQHMTDPMWSFGFPSENRRYSTSLPRKRLSRLTRSFTNHVPIFSKSTTVHSPVR